MIVEIGYWLGYIELVVFIWVFMLWVGFILFVWRELVDVSIYFV